MTDVDRLRRRIDDAAHAVEAAKTQLYKKDGSRIFADAEHAERVQQIDGEFKDGEFKRVADEVTEELATIEEEKASELHQHRHGDPTDSLVGAQLERMPTLNASSLKRTVRLWHYPNLPAALRVCFLVERKSPSGYTHVIRECA